MADDLTRAMRRRLSESAQNLDWLSRRLVSPSAYAAHQRLKLQAMQLRLAHATRTPLGLARYAVNQLDTRLRAQLPDIAAERRRLAEQGRRLQTQAVAQQRQRRQALMALASQLELLNPQRTLERGYAIITDGAGAVVRSPSQLRPKQVLSLRLADGGADVDAGQRAADAGRHDLTGQDAAIAHPFYNALFGKFTFNPKTTRTQHGTYSATPALRRWTRCSRTCPRKPWNTTTASITRPM